MKTPPVPKHPKTILVVFPADVTIAVPLKAYRKFESKFKRLTRADFEALATSGRLMEVKSVDVLPKTMAPCAYVPQADGSQVEFCEY